MPSDPPAATEHVTHMRLRPGMYIGPTDTMGIEHLASELIANSVDQFLAGNVSRIAVRLNGNRITVSDDGPGIEGAGAQEDGLARADRFLTQYHPTPTADGHAPHIHLTFLGVGLVAVNALSSHLVLRMHSNGFLHEAVYRRGVRSDSRVKPAARGKQGTAVTFTPDAEIFGKHRPRPAALRRIAFHAAHLFPGVQIQFNKERFHAPGGLGDLVTLFAPHHGPDFSVSVDAGVCFVHAAAAGVSKTTQWQSWVNGAPTPGHGTHVDGFRSALRSVDWEPDFAAVHVVMQQPRYAGPTRDKFFVKEVHAALRQALLPHLRALERNRQD
jgi:DNA gyrase/topoisomerase IV subunit B